MTEVKDAVNLRTPAQTYNGLRAQASLMNISGRGRMNKAQLIEAISREITRQAAQSLVDGTDGQLSVQPNGDGTTTYTLPANPRQGRYDEIMSKAIPLDTTRQHGPVVTLNDFPYVAHGPVEAPEGDVGTVKMSVNLDSLNAALRRAGRGEVVTEEHLRSQGMEPMRPASLVTTSYGRVLSTHDVPRVESCGLAPGESIVDVKPIGPDHITVEVSPFVAEAVSAALADSGTRVWGHKGASVRQTREHRKTYPASKVRRGGKRGRE